MFIFLFHDLTKLINLTFQRLEDKPSQYSLESVQELQVFQSSTQYETIFSIQSLQLLNLVNVTTLKLFFKPSQKLHLSDIDSLSDFKNLVIYHVNFLIELLKKLTHSITHSKIKSEYIHSLLNIHNATEWRQTQLLVMFSTIDGIFYQFPYQYLTQMDPNQQNFLSNNAVYQSIDITVYYDITGDISGFSSLEGYIRLIGQDTGENGFYFQPLSFTSPNLVSGNIRNGRYYFKITLPQYINGTYQFGIQSITDQVGNTNG
ncbi:hypothetical protein DLAC_02841 [Tieghemostelium lacteum]|uniref:Uncharacterized protein n=1 Tax=Tieghemostelium lacteum TaxID=361077 RepID=A0A152A409_TIELA|nr:hypothetical protein DLAC_02841 [Tieghemostelium lacteum]|eukprot:KYR00791.1 hypothetical protein DLAC_02841 [Tieghemostelium lacteum]